MNRQQALEKALEIACLLVQQEADGPTDLACSSVENDADLEKVRRALSDIANSLNTRRWKIHLILSEKARAKGGTL